MLVNMSMAVLTVVLDIKFKNTAGCNTHLPQPADDLCDSAGYHVPPRGVSDKVEA